jgi:hypothetical protein
MSVHDANVIHSIANALPTGANTIGSATALSGATEDAAPGASQFYPLGARYLGYLTRTRRATGNQGRLNMSSRSGMLTARDYDLARGTETVVASVSDMLVSTNGAHGNYAVPTAASFAWVASTEVRHYAFEYGIAGHRAASVSFRNALAATARLRLKLWISGTPWAADDAIVIYDAQVANSGEIAILSKSPGANNTNVGVCEALSDCPAAFLLVEVVPLVAATGNIFLAVGRS